MKLISNDFEHNKEMGASLSGHGKGKSPHLSWSDLPEGTKSLALFCHDPDAPIASGFWHWQVVNIPLTLTEVEHNKSESLEGLQKLNDADKVGYIPPGPPKGTGVHKYNFTLYALPFEKLDEVMLDNGLKLTAESSKAYTAFFVEANKIDSVTLTGLDEYKD